MHIHKFNNHWHHPILTSLSWCNTKFHIISIVRYDDEFKKLYGTDLTVENLIQAIESEMGILAAGRSLIETLGPENILSEIPIKIIAISSLLFDTLHYLLKIYHSFSTISTLARKYRDDIIQYVFIAQIVENMPRLDDDEFKFFHKRTSFFP